MDKMFNILALMSVPLSVVICRAWLKSKEIEARGALAELVGLRSECAELRQRIETLENERASWRRCFTRRICGPFATSPSPVSLAACVSASGLRRL